MFSSSQVCTLNLKTGPRTPSPSPGLFFIRRIREIS
jgi:hypothetical protein